MRRSWAAVTVGALALVVLVGAYSLFMYTSEQADSEGYTVYAYFNDALGLHEKSGVRSAGIDVGTIVGKEYDPKVRKAKVTIRVNKDMPLYENAVVSKKSASLLGEFYLELDPGTEREMRAGQERVNRLLKEGDQIVFVTEATSVSDLMDQVDQTMPILQQILRDVQELTSGPVRQMAENANDLVARNSIVFERLLTRVDNIAADVEGITREESDDIKIAIENVREITEGMKSLVGKSEGEVAETGQEIRTSLQSLQDSVQSLENSLENVEVVTQRLKEGEGTVGKLLAEDKIANNIEEITDDAGGFLRGITRVQTIIGLRTEWNVLSKTFKNYISVRLSPRPDKFYLIEIVDDPRGLREVTRTSTQSSDRNLVEQTTVKTSLDKLRFSLQYGKRIGFFVGRFGIKESTGGFGADLLFFEDRLSLSVDLFDARSNEFPRLQARGSFAVYKDNLFLVAGVDDVLNQRPTIAGGGAFFDTFFGFQLRFSDEDLKSMLFLGGGALAGAGSN